MFNKSNPGSQRIWARPVTKMKNISISALASTMSNLNRRHFGGAFSSKELTDILRETFGVMGARRVLSDLENHGVLRFLNARKCQFIMVPSVEVIKNLI